MILWRHSSYRLSLDNSLVLSESLGQNAVQILADVAISDIFPKQCEDLNGKASDARCSFRQKLAKRQDQVRQELSNQEASFRLALREEVVDHVINAFPCVFSSSTALSIQYAKVNLLHSSIKRDELPSYVPVNCDPFTVHNVIRTKLNVWPFHSSHPCS